MRFWAKIINDNHLIKDYVAERYGEESRTAKVFSALEESCAELNLPLPIWLKNNVKDFQRVAKCRFRQDSFIEEIPFDFLEFQVIEEDKSSPL
ncbi:MAG: hypothetical protein IJR95_04830 [Lachnospiraceae bacterium]|nr:hypothetical protein [Lachnospiraceae bacterium]